MPQVGIHAIVGVVSRRWMPRREWLLLGVVLGNIFPDLDNFVVAYATLAKLPDPEQYHRTFTHSLFTVLTVISLFYMIGAITRRSEEHTSELQSQSNLVCRLLLEKKKKITSNYIK